MRRKITETEEILQDSSLPELTEQQRNFVFCLLQGKSASDAYRASYNCSGSRPNTVWAEASKLKSHPNIAQWLATARKAGLGTAKLTLDSHLQELERLREIAIDKGNLGAAIQAENFRGKASGHYTERLEMTTADPEATLKLISQYHDGTIDGAKIARNLARQENIPWPEHDDGTGTAH